MRSAPAIAFDYRPSRWVAAALCATALLGAAAILASGLDAVSKAAALAALAAYAGVSLRRFLRPPVQRCAWHANGEWRVRDRTGDEHPAILLRAASRGPLLALVLRAGPLRRVPVLLLPDNSDVDLRRQLRVRLARSAPDAAGPAADA